jgi:hypothetical protein
MQPPRKPWHPPACHKVEAVCKHFLFVASGKQPRQSLQDSEKNKTKVWQCAKAKPFGKIFIGGFAFAHSHF